MIHITPVRKSIASSVRFVYQTTDYKISLEYNEECSADWGKTEATCFIKVYRCTKGIRQEEVWVKDLDTKEMKPQKIWREPFFQERTQACITSLTPRQKVVDFIKESLEEFAVDFLDAPPDTFEIPVEIEEGLIH